MKIYSEIIYVPEGEIRGTITVEDRKIIAVEKDIKDNDAVDYGSLRIIPGIFDTHNHGCLLYTSPSPRDSTLSRMPSSA